MATEQELAQALSPAFGMYPKAFRGNTGNPQDAANLPVDVMRGRTAGLLGMFGDVVNQPSAFTPVRAVQLAMQGVMGQDKYPDTEQFLKTLPLKPTSKAGEVAGQAASFVPLNPAPAVRAAKAGVQALGPTASNMAEDFLMRRGLMPTLDVYHGTPHTLPPTERNPLGEFDASKIGTGEGAQAYGFGIYTAENPAVAGGYAKTLSKNTFLSPNGTVINKAKLIDYGFDRGDVDVMLHALKNNNGDFGLAADAIASRRKSASEFLKSIGNKGSMNEGSLYKVDLPDAMIPKMLDYDKPLSKQPEIMKALTPEAMGLKLRVAPEGGFMSYVSPDGVPIGLQVKGATPENFRKKWLDRIAEFGEAEGGAGRVIGYLGGNSPTSAAQVSEALRQAGIPGIKYLDEASRAEGRGTRNFVTFPGEEKNLTILERNAEKSAK
jgi:hypothetical protein